MVYSYGIIAFRTIRNETACPSLAVILLSWKPYLYVSNEE
jgi:hypothetical protein